ncbi:unnamed protein product [Euphydryas editha]|uniref:Gustatory receptor n=1 Tax=Euphydryas editha TaxID=104508 RepID=A0AAU9UBJ3_EUPED|nr:unnamed protein product [Euphydryas editha]
MNSVKPILISKPKQPISKLLKTFFIIIHIVYGHDYGFVKYKSTRHKFIIKLSTAVFSASLATVLLILISKETEELQNVIWFSSYVFMNYAYIIMLLIIPERNTFYILQEHLRSIDSEINADTSSYFLDLKILLLLIITIADKIITTIVYCWFFGPCINNIFTQILFMIPCSSLDMPIIVYYFLFHATYMRLITMRKFINDRKFKPKQMQIIYKSLHDTVENIKNAFDPLIIFTLLTSVPNIMIIIYIAIKDTKEGKKNVSAFINEAMIASLIMAKIFAPAIGASSLSTEVAKIKVVLHDMLLLEEDETKIQDIKRFISYIEARPFKFRVLKVIHLDATFPVAVLNLCVTYLIVILQLTHIY